MHRTLHLSYVEMLEAIDKFVDAVSEHPIEEHWWYPTKSHRGWPTWNNDVDVDEDGDVTIGVEVSCCGSWAYCKYRTVPGDIFLNPTTENLDALKLVYEEDDRQAKIFREQELEKQKRKDAEKAKERRYQEYLRLKEEFE